MASLKSQLEKATLDLNNAKYKREQALSLRDDTRYIKFKDRPADERESINAKITEASANFNQAQKYYNNILKAYNKELETKKITGQIDGLTEEDQAANLGITVEQLRANKEAALTEQQKKERDAARAAGASVNTGNVPIEDFLKNLDAASTDTINEVKADLGIKNLDGKLDYATIIAIYAKEKEIETVADATGRPVDRLTYYKSAPKTGEGAVPFATISSPTTASAIINSVFQSELRRDATADEVQKYTVILNDAERKNPSKTVKGITTGGLNKTEFLTQLVKKLPEYSTKKSDTRSLNIQTLQSTAKVNGINLSPQQLEQYALDIQNGKDIKVINNDIRTTAGLGRPDSVKKLLAQGTDLETIYSPYKRTMASLLEIDPNSIDINDTTLQGAITDRELPIYEFRRLLKKDPRWQYTNNAREEVSNKVLRVLRDFGFQG